MAALTPRMVHRREAVRHSRSPSGAPPRARRVPRAGARWGRGYRGPYIDVAPAEALRSLEAEHWEEGDPLADRNDPAVLAADAAAFAPYVEASPAFQIPMQLRSAEEFAFEIDDIG
jgi:hypothetical protein